MRLEDNDKRNSDERENVKRNSDVSLDMFKF